MSSEITASWGRRRGPTAIRGWVRVSLMVVFAAVGVFAAGVQARAETVNIFELQPRHIPPGQPAMCLDVANASQAHLAPVIQGRCEHRPNQRWWFRNVGGNVWEIHALHSGKCLDVANMRLDHGAPVIQGDCWSGPNQRWRQVGGNGVFVFQPTHIPPGRPAMCLDVAHFSLSHLAPIVQAQCSGGLNQSWLKLSVGSLDV